VLLTTGLFAAVYAVGVAAAVRLLPRPGLAHAAALVALAAVLALLVMTGIYLLWPVLVALAALLFLRLARPGDRTPADPEGAL
jgi:amino acid efflux transporter